MLQDHSLAFPGFLWKIDSLLDLTWLRDRYGSAWTLILFYTTYFQRVEDEGQSLDDFLRPYIAFFEPTVERPATFNELRSIVSHLAATELTEWKPPYDRRALKIETFALHCSILLYLILFLRENNEMGLADAIWNSAQGASWPIDSQFKDDDDVPASVRDFPDTLPDSLKVDTLFEFETNKQGGWLQSWVAWRIMTRGELWYGNQVETSSDTEEPAPTFQKSESKTEEENIEDLPSTLARTQLGAEPTSANTSSVPQGQTYHGEETSNSEQSTKSQGQADSGPRGRYLNQFTKSILARDVMKMLLEDAGHKTNRNLFHDDPGAYVLFAQLVSTGPGGQSERRDRRAFFDVDEPSLVLTPFNTNMEVLPRPETRAMSASWVVKCSENPPPAISEVDGRAPVVESFKYVKAVKGMWAVGYHAFTRYAVSCVDEPEGEADKKEENHPDSVEQGRK